MQKFTDLSSKGLETLRTLPTSENKIKSGLELFCENPYI